ncbi:MAG: selenium-dependent xanthine dehydrogenase, partial [Myxococcales bacterium]|nr:selenium-dependent xanthine dehydrogenase [Myxococcales bacterium]
MPSAFAAPPQARYGILRRNSNATEEVPMQFTLNGRSVSWDGDPEISLMDYLRDVQAITSTKDGCNGQGVCGCCTVLVDEAGKMCCTLPLRKIEGKSVTTMEGLRPFERQCYATAFAELGGAQCGFCIPGFVMKARAVLEKAPAIDRDALKKKLNPNLCRCTGYEKIIDSIMLARDALANETPIVESPCSGGAGSRLQRDNAKRLTLGERPYVADLRLEGMLHGALRFSEHPRAILRSLDTSKAEALPGVTRVITAGDIPGDRRVGLIYKDWSVIVGVGDEIHYIGDVLCVVVAVDETTARQAAALVEAEYEVLTPVTTIDEALADGAPQIHAAIGKANALGVCKVKRGQASDVLERCAHVHHATYETQFIEHAFMEPECCVAAPSDDPAHAVTVYSQGQGVFEDRRQIAELLGLEESQVQVVLMPNGGGFGGKEDLSVQGHAALAATLLDRPIRLRLTREESIRVHPKRHPLRMQYTLGCDEQGKLQALYARIWGDTGAYASVGTKVLERAAGHATGAYYVPHTDIEATTVYTNNIPCGAMRGFGANQAAFALECAVDELCEMGGFDRWQFRYDNALIDGSCTSTGQVLEGGVGVRACLDAVKPFYDAHPHVGLACGIKNTGIGNGMPDSSQAKIVIGGADKVTIHHGWTEMGQGVNTVAKQFLCEETGIDPTIVEVIVDTSAESAAGMTTASRATSLLGNAIIDACKRLREDLQQHSLAELAGRTYDGEWTCNWTTKPGADVERVVTHYSYSYAAQLAILDERGKLVHFVAAHDAGKIINPTLFEGQLQGSIHMGIGYALTEELVMEGGWPTSFNLNDCGVLRIREMPEMTIIGVEVPDPHGPYGAKGVGEIGLVPTAPAVANALAAFDGVRRRSLPMTD